MYITGQVSVFLGVRDPNACAKLRSQLVDYEHLNVVGFAHQSSDIVVAVGKLKPDVLIVDASIVGNSPETFGDVIRNSSEHTKILLLGFQGTLQDFLPMFQHGIYGSCSAATTSNLIKIAVESVMKGSVWFQPGVANVPCKVNSLSVREKEVLKLVMNGHRNASIAQVLKISPETVKSHMHRMMEKLVVHSRTQLVVEAIRLQVC
ncbi:MAG: response regulator transcription factor [Cyanobacteria bacterium SZAS-4]|nr:response regulator transcription factor [Cyanobacteria bacterium SZAS-4]